MGRERRERFSLLQRVLAPAINKPRKNAQRRKRHGEPGLTGKTDVPASDSLQTVMDCFADELVVVGSDFRVHQVNSAVTRRLGKPAEDIIGQFCYQVNHGAEEPCQPPWCECPLNHVMETGKPARVVHTHKEGQADGGERWVEIMVSPVCNGGGQITGVLELVRDISKDRKLKKEVLRANRELLAVNSTARALNQSLDLKATLQAAAEGLLEALEAQLSWIQLSDDDGKLPTAWASELPEEVSDELMEIISNMRSSKEAATSASYSIIPGGAELNQTLWQFIVTPLQSKGVVWGKAGVATARRPVDQQRIQLLDAIGHQIAAAIERCKLYEEVQAGRDTLGKLLHRIITTQEEERRRIARELHDETGQALFVLRLSLERLALTPSTSKDEMKSRLEQSLRLCQQADEEVDKLIFDLRPALLDDLGLVPAIEFYSQSRLKAAGTQLNLKVTGKERRLSSDKEVALFRVTQEGVSNIVKHARATNASIHLRFTKNKLIVRIEDDGCGFDMSKLDTQNPRCGLGLVGMKERMSLVGGSLSIVSRPGAGTHIIAVVPLDEEKEDS